MVQVLRAAFLHIFFMRMVLMSAFLLENNVWQILKTKVLFSKTANLKNVLFHTSRPILNYTAMKQKSVARTRKYLTLLVLSWPIAQKGPLL